MSEQLPLLFELRADYTLGTFVAGPNAAVITALLGVGHAATATGAAVYWLHGAAGAGKTHLLQGCVAELAQDGRRLAYVPAARIPAAAAVAVLEGLEAFDAVCIDDLHLWLGAIALERELVRLYQELRSRGRHLVLAAATPAPAATFALPDWRSRCIAAAPLALLELDDDAKLVVLRARAARLGLTLDDKVGTYLLRHGSRALPDLLGALVRLDRAALATRRQLTVPLIKQVLGW